MEMQENKERRSEKSWKRIQVRGKRKEVLEKAIIGSRTEGVEYPKHVKSIRI